MSLTTRLSLIDALKQGGGAAAWERFYQTYSGVLVSFARKQGCDEHTSLDVLQETVMVILRKLPGFDYDKARGRFRNWLMTITANKVREAVRRAKVDKMLSLDVPDENDQTLADKLPAASADASENLERDWRQTLLEEALRRIMADPRTSAESIAVFRAVALENRAPADVARDFSMTENNVYQIKNRLMNRVRSIVAQLESGQLHD